MSRNIEAVVAAEDVEEGSGNHTLHRQQGHQQHGDAKGEPQSHQVQNLTEQENNSSTDTGDEISLDSLRSLYLSLSIPSVNGRLGQLLRRGSSSITYTTTPVEFPPVIRLDPLNKKRILVTGVSTQDLSIFHSASPLYTLSLSRYPFPSFPTHETSSTYLEHFFECSSTQILISECIFMTHYNLGKVLIAEKFDC